MLWNKFNLFTFKIICNIILSITNLASWMMVQAPPTTASLFWFYYRYIYRKAERKGVNLKLNLQTYFLSCSMHTFIRYTYR